MTMHISSRAHTLGFDSERLAKIAPFLQDQYVNAGKIPCAQVLIARKGETVLECSSGYMSVEHKTALQSDTIFRIYSMTKPLTSVAFMMLVEEGKVALDEPVAKYIAEFKNLQVYESGALGSFVTRPCQRPMQIIDLLRHTSGLTYGFQMRTPVDAAYRELKLGEVATAGTLDEMIAKLATIPLEFSPGTAWNYSVSTDVLGYLVSKISGEPFETFLHRRILQPLRMVDTDFYVPPAKANRFADCYLATQSGGMSLADSAAKSPYLRPAGFISGGGGLVSTTADYARFCTMMMRGGELGGKRYLGRKTVELMQSNHLPSGKYLPDMSVSMFSESIFNGVGFGLGFSVVENPAATMIAGSAREAAWGGMASTAFWLDPQEDLFVIFMTQLIPSSTYAIRRQLRTMVYASLR